MRIWAGEVKNFSVLVAIVVGKDGYRRILGVYECHKKGKSGWSGFLALLKERGLHGVRLVISDTCIGLVGRSTNPIPRRIDSGPWFV